MIWESGPINTELGRFGIVLRSVNMKSNVRDGQFLTFD